jgi:prepilin-type N-terminal cleavage/methylation domain-containing protein
MKNIKVKNEQGFSLLELLIAMGIVVVLMGITSLIFGKSLGIRARESSRTDALTSAQAALNVMSREITNSGYGLFDEDTHKNFNGIVFVDSSSARLRIRANITNSNDNGGNATTTEDVSEDVTYYFDSDAQSIVRYDPAQNPQTTYLVNRISEVKFKFYDYTDSNSTPVESDTPSEDTSQVRITVIVKMDDVMGQPKDQKVKLESYVTLRNSNYMINQY